MADIRPTSYEEWKHCITVICGIPLTESYVRQRIEALHDTSDHMTSKFVELYGEPHLRQTIAWFEQALNDLTT